MNSYKVKFYNFAPFCPFWSFDHLNTTPHHYPPLTTSVWCLNGVWNINCSNLTMFWHKSVKSVKSEEMKNWGGVKNERSISELPSENHLWRHSRTCTNPQQIRDIAFVGIGGMQWGQSGCWSIIDRTKNILKYAWFCNWGDQSSSAMILHWPERVCADQFQSGLDDEAFFGWWYQFWNVVTESTTDTLFRFNFSRIDLGLHKKVLKLSRNL